MVAADYAKETVIPMPTAAAASGASSGMLSSPYLVAAGMDMELGTIASQILNGSSYM